MSTFLWIVGSLFALGFISMLLLPLIFSFANLPSTNKASPINRLLSNQYYWQEGKAVYVAGGNFFQVGEKAMPTHDTQTFEVIACDFAKDKDYVFHHDRIIEDIESNSVVAIADPLVKKSRDGLIAVFLKDAKHVFWGGSIVDGADPQSFSPITHSYGHDNSNLYYGDKKVATLLGPIKSLHVDWRNDYLAMGDQVFYNGRPTEVSAESFEQIQDDYFRDHKAVIRYGDVIAGADPKSYQFLNAYFHKDKNRCYYLHQPIAECNAATFMAFNDRDHGTSFAKDDHHVYYETRIITNENPIEFNRARALELNKPYRWRPLRIDERYVSFIPDDQVESVGPYWVHNQRLYTDQQRLEHITASDISQYGKSRYFLIKASHIEYNLQPIHDVDITSFVVINDNFAKDKNRIYYNQHPIEGIKPNTYIPRAGDFGRKMEDGTYRLDNHYDNLKDTERGH